jgi:N-acetylmuramate 1-kinase
MTTAIFWPDAARQAAFENWLNALAPRFGLDPASLVPATADASFRRYLRIQGAGDLSYIVMDAPPPQEDVRPFVRIAGLIGAAGLHAPQVLAADEERGFLLLSDLGHRVYLDLLRQATPQQADTLMRPALTALVKFQLAMPADSLPPCDESWLAQELALFPQWCVQREFGISWTEPQQAVWERSCKLLIDSALAQPVVAVHADYMVRNLMQVEPADRSPGILDFQDAMRGPITYDLVCLLRDAFVSWDEPQEIDWAVRWWDEARRAGLPVDADFGEFWRALEWMGLLRHLRVMGIFCRLKHRDGKPHYAQELPRFFAYANRVALRYGPLKPLLRLIEPLSGARVEAGYTF